MISMAGPPDPHIPDLLLIVAARLGFRVLSRDLAGRELGVLCDSSGDRPLVLAAGASPGLCAWGFLNAGPMPKMAYLLTQATYDALHYGSLAEDGVLTYKGARYRIQASFDGVAELTPI
jgi:hypothetical protein